MNNKLINFFVLIALFFFSNLAQAADTMFIMNKTGTKTPYLVSDIRKLTFPLGNMLVTKVNGTTSTFILNDLKYFSYKDYTITTGNSTLFNHETNLKLYPNPVIDVLNISFGSNNDKSIEISIIDLYGKIAFQTNTSGDKNISINLASLKKGIYLCRIKSGDYVTIEKFIKI